MENEIFKAANLIKESDTLLICAGAGIGVDSGLPDFRGNQGFWKAYPPFARLGYSFVDMANPQWFLADPHLAWGFYGHRLNLYRNTLPHEGYEILKQLGQRKPGGCFVFTSNVDGQFQKAGFSENRIVECHGSIHYLQCVLPCTNKIWPIDNTSVQVDESTMKALGPLPLCPECNEIARPNILMFGDWNWISSRTDHQEFLFHQWLHQARTQSITIIECGAGTAVPTVRRTSERVISEFGARLIRINIREPEVPPGQIGLRTGALESLKAVKNIL